nr:uncharacterized protein LOC123758434 [Procambarus clarkii]
MTRRLREQRARVAGHLLVVVVALVLRAASCEPLVARCPPAGALDHAHPHCECNLKIQRSGNTVNIKCDFDNMENVVLNKELFSFRNFSLTSAYVRMVNASSLLVTGEFLQEWLQAPSAALDIWHGGNLTLESMPQLDNHEKLAAYRTFVGIGIVSCNISEVPEKLLRDRTRGGFRIKSSRVGIFRKGALHNIKQMRYLVLDDTVVDVVEGSVASEGFVTLSTRTVHSWSGLLLSNVTIASVGPDAFNLTHQSDMEVALLVNSQLGTVGTGALTAAGDITVTITGNYFQKLQKQAFKVDVTGDVIFDENVIEAWERDALEGLVCHNRTSLERNVIHVATPQDLALNDTSTPFHTSCGNPQIFLVINIQHPLELRVTTSATWVLVALLALLVLASVALYTYRAQDGLTRYYGLGRFPILLNGRKASQENLPSNAEINEPAEDAEAAEGMANPMYSEAAASPSTDPS